MSFNKDLKYAEINYACIHGGRKVQDTSSGIRPKKRNFLEDKSSPTEEARPSHDLIKQDNVNAKEQQQISRDHEELSCQASCSAMLEGTNYPHDRRQSSSHQMVSAIKMPSKQVKRGRPEGITVIGLPNKKQKELKCPKSFEMKSPTARIKEMLGWFVDKKVVNAVLHSDSKPLIKEHQVETHLERVPIKC